MKPPTLQRAGVAVDGLNIYGVAIVAWVPAAIPEKLPVLPAVTLLNPALPNTSRQVFTLVAVAKEVVSNATEPAKLMNPVIGIAWAEIAKLEATIIAAKLAKRGLISFIIPIFLFVKLSCGLGI